MEKIIAKINGDESETIINVMVSDLYPMPGGNYRLTGNERPGPGDLHPDNHYGTYYTVVYTRLMAEDFYEQFDATLGINDMSLARGGLFDICGTWNPADTCSNAPDGGHRSHRKGTSVDINRNALTLEGWISVDKGYIEDRCWERGKGKLAPEATIHCEFPK